MGRAINPHIFREYDIRGIADRDLTDETAFIIARAFADRVRKEAGRTVVLGRDVRESSPRLSEAWARGLSAGGLAVIRVGVVPTPVLYFAVEHLAADAGVMITGSHNPIEYNGFKLQLGSASLHGDGILDLARRCEAGQPGDGAGSVEDRPILDDYCRMVVSRCRPDRPLRLVVDAGNGTAGPVAVPILEELGHCVVPIYCEPDGRFPNHPPDPTVEDYMEDLKARVVREGADLGIGYDGDADRIGAVDERGVLLLGDQLLALFARDSLSRLPGAPVVFDVKCSQGLEEDIVAHGGRPVLWKSGHSLTKAKMKEAGAPLAGELSGHIFFQEDFYGFDDAIYASARFAAILSRSDWPLSRHRNDLPQYVNSPEIRISCPDSEKFRVAREVGNALADRYPVNDIDGARVSFGYGWGLIRASNTQPVLVLRFEARSARDLARIEAEFRALLARHPEAEWG